MISVKEAADLLQLSQPQVYRLIKDGILPCRKLGRQFYLEKSDIDLHRERNHTPSLFPEPGKQEFGHDLPLHIMMRKAGIFYEVPGTSVREVIYQSLIKIEGIDSQMMDPIYRMFLSREELASSGIGDGIAIPHARGSLVGFIDQPLLSLSFLQTPIDFEAPDGKPVSALFMLISPNVQTHLRILARLAWLLQQPGCKSAITGRAEADTILQAFTQAETGSRA